LPPARRPDGADALPTPEDQPVNPEDEAI